MTNKQLLHQGLLLEDTTLIWNVFECLLVLYAGITAHSVAMTGFGIDSIIEIFASVVVIWQLKAINKKNEKLAENLIAIAFILLALYIGSQSVLSLVHHNHPLPSVLGMFSLLATMGGMFTLAYLKNKVGKQLQNTVLMRESRVTYIDGLLAASVLVGIVLETFAGIWWADSLAGFVLVFYSLQEAFHVFLSHKQFAL